jgi:energy-coupling factor transport system permease protein
MLSDAYLARRGYLHALDPRAKALLVVAATVLALSPGGNLQAGVHAAAVLLALVVGLGLRETFRPIRAVVVLMVFLIVLTPLFHREGDVLVAVGGQTILTDRGLEETYRLLCRLLTITLVFYLFFRTTEVDAVIAAARWFGMPYVACLVLGVVARLVPTTVALYHGVQDAHSLRRPPGPEVGRGLRARLRRLGPVVAAVLVHSVRSIPVLAMALETRGLGRPNRRSTLHRLPPVGRAARDLTLGLLALGLPQLLVWLL